MGGAEKQQLGTQRVLLFSFQIEFWLSEHLADGVSWYITNLWNSSCEHQVVIGGRNEPSLYLLDVALISAEAAFFWNLLSESNSFVWHRPGMSPLTWILFFFSHPWNKFIVMLLLSCYCRSLQPSTQKQSTWGSAKWRENGSWECRRLSPDGPGSNGPPTGLNVVQQL